MAETEAATSIETDAGETGPGLGVLINAVMDGVTEDARIEAWHEYAEHRADELHADVLEARRALHHGTPADAVALADRHVPARAQAAAQQPAVERQAYA
jgi:hypothetical protein